MKNLIKKILREDFDWVRDVKPEPTIGSCIVDKLDPSQTRWAVESEGETPSGTEVIDISDGKKTLSLNKKFFLEDYYNGRYVFCNKLVNESDDFDWVRDVDIFDYLERPYFKNMEKHGLSPNEYESTLSKVFNQPVTIKGRNVWRERNPSKNKRV